MSRREWHPNDAGIVFAVITHDDGHVWTVNPNTEKEARHEAETYDGDGGAIAVRMQFLAPARSVSGNPKEPHND